MFQLVDLRQNFYYSYTYDLTNTLQQNLTSIKRTNDSSDEKTYGVYNKPCSKFLWNEFLLKQFSEKISYCWKLNLVHGYLSQSSLNIYGCNLLVTLIARRSQKYAGTRFLKRGGNNEGFVANEVETEQIVHNASISSFQKGYYTSFVHLRGSIPLFWSQDPKAVPKPPITIDITDPFATVAARHFKQLMCRFGAPLVILNLVKIREKKPQESIIANEFKLSLDYLKQFLPQQNYIDYICLDMSKLNKNAKGNVMNKLYEIAESCVEKTGFFQNFPRLDCNTKFLDSDMESELQSFIQQKGVVRTNCVDCLDRTNTAMYVIGKCAMAHQLHALGILYSPDLGQESVCERMLIDLYEKCGDSIAQQYAGSQLVHRVDTYGKNSGLASQSRDMIHTISRYYSNAFADADKQNAINLFLGIYEPSQYHNFNIWDLHTDCYLHDDYIMQPWKIQRNYIDWIDRSLFDCLPLPSEQTYKSLSNFAHVEKIKEKNDPRISSFDNFYKPHEFTAFHEIFYFMNLVTNRITSNNSTGLSGNLKSILDPFRMMRSAKKLANNKNAKEVNYKEANSSEEDSDDSFEVIPEQPFQTKMIKEKIGQNEKFNENSVNFTVSDTSIEIYKQYAANSKQISNGKYEYIKENASWGDFSEYSNISIPKPRKISFNKQFDPNNFFKIKFDEQNANPVNLIKDETRKIYENFLKIGAYGPTMPNEANIKLYQEHAAQMRVL